MNQDANRNKKGPKGLFLSFYIVFILDHIISYTGVAHFYDSDEQIIWLNLKKIPTKIPAFGQFSYFNVHL